MQISAERTAGILREVFPECNDIKISTETQLGELPEFGDHEHLSGFKRSIWKTRSTSGPIVCRQR
jgi:hypothetical protein